jgi:hypothetical protein
MLGSDLPAGLAPGFVYIDSLFQRRFRSRRFDDETIGPVTPIVMLGIQTFA